MLGSILFATALIAADTPLDADDLKAAMQGDRQAGAIAPVGRPFRIEIPFVDGRKRDVRTFQSPARWVYDYKRSQLDLIIGPGEITPINYDQFAPQGLSQLPPLQSFVFDSRQITDMTSFNIDNQTKAQNRANDGLGDGRGDAYEAGTVSRVTSFALAVPYDAKGVSGLPDGMKPLAIHKVPRLPQHELRRFVGHMSLVLEGETTDLGQKPPTFCGAFRGGVQSQVRADREMFSIFSKQCFVTARLTKVTVLRGNEVLASWPRPAAAAD
jgi:hypothetical protein